MNRAKLDRAIEEIEWYTAQHAELQKAHHFLFDLPIDRDAGKPEFVVIGVNPGESAGDWRLHPKGREQETWKRDFHEATDAPRSPGSKKWRANARFFSNDRPVVLAELFFWSSKNRAELESRFGPLWQSPHLDFCADKLRLLINEYDPTAVIFVGLGEAQHVARLFDLQEVDRLFDKRNGNKLLIEYRERNGRRPWFFAKHWSGAFGFSNEQKKKIKAHIHAE
jgi:hypothetical protein